MTAAIVALALFGALWWVAILAGPPVDELRVGEWHHAHLGVALALLGLAVGWRILAWVGVGILADDAVQHALQRWYAPSWRSPLHILYQRTVARIRWVQRLNTYLDRLAGKQ